MMDNLQPIYRIEDFWYAIVNGLSCPHTPIYRIEQYLAFLCGSDVEVPQPIYRIEQYLAYKCGLDVELPAPIYRQELFLAKWCGLEVDTPDPIYRIEYWLDLLANPAGELKTVTGNPISVSDALAKPAESLTIEILPQQSGSGDPSPDNVRPISGWDSVKVTRTGKNLLPNALTQSGSSIVMLGQSDTTSFGLSLKAGTYTVSLQSSKSMAFYYRAENGTENIHIGGYNVKQATFTLEEDTTIRLYAYLSAGISVADITDAQLELGSTATDYEPYQGTTYSISWQDETGTVYGGSLDVVSGVLTVDRAKVDITSNGSSWAKSGSYPGGFYINDFGFNAFYGIRPKQMTPFICSHAKTANNISEYQPGTCYCDRSINIRIMPSGSTPTDWNDYLVAQNANGTPVQVCVTLATPIEIQLTQTEIEMLLGNNVIWNDVGDSELQYWAVGS